MNNPSSLNESIKFNNIFNDQHYHQKQQNNGNQPFHYKIDLKKDSEFFDLLLTELKHAVSLHELEKEKFNKEIKELESQLLVAVNFIYACTCIN